MILCGGAINSPQLLQLSGVGNAGGARGARHRRSCTTCPASASTSRTTSRSTSSTPRTQPVSMQPSAHEVAQPAVRSARKWLFLRSGPGRDEPLRGRRVRAQQRRRRLPEPDVPLPAARDPLRRLVARRRPRLPGARRPDVLGRPRHGEDHDRRTRASTRRCASTTCRPSRTGASGWRRSASRGTSSTQPAFEPFNGGEISPGPVGRDRRGDPRLGRPRRARPRSTRRAPAGWASTTMSVVDPLTMRVHGLDGPARRRRVGHSRTSRTATSTRR